MKNDGSEGLKLEGGNTMVELVSAALIVSGFWVLLELGRTVWRGTSRKSRSMNSGVDWSGKRVCGAICGSIPQAGRQLPGYAKEKGVFRG